MADILVLAETDGDNIVDATLEALTAARQLDGDIHVLLCGDSVDPDDAAALCQILRHESSDPDNCLFALWAGCGWEPGARATLTFQGVGDGDAVPDGGDTAPVDPVPQPVRRGPLVELPHRDYFLYRGPVEDALAFVDAEQQSAHLWWPQDRSWCVATELDLEFTYVGGSTDLIGRVLTSPDLEAVEALPTESTIGA